MRRPKYSKLRSDIISHSEEDLSRRSKNLQRALYSATVSYLLSSLSTENGNVEDSSKNHVVINQLDKKIDFSKETLGFKKWIVQRVLKILGANRKYFESEKESYIDKAEKNVLKSIGLSKRGNSLSISKGGYLDNILDMSEPVKTIKKVARNSVASPLGKTKTLKEDLRQVIQGGDGLGVIESKVVTENIFPKVDRVMGYKVANYAGQRAAIYGGGIITTTRDFCKERNDKVFTVEEIASWADLEFAGKQKVGYNPFLEPGGHNCRHRFDYISDDLAIIYRPELKQIWGIK